MIPGSSVDIEQLRPSLKNLKNILLYCIIYTAFKSIKMIYFENIMMNIKNISNIFVELFS